MPVVNSTTIDLLLFMDPKDYVKIAEQLSDSSESDITTLQVPELFESDDATVKTRKLDVYAF